MAATRGGTMVGVVIALGALTGCSAAPQVPLAPPPGFSEPAPVSADAAEPAAQGSRSDQDGDGFVNKDEAEGYYRSHFKSLDDDNDGRLSEAELQPDDSVPSGLKTAWDDLVGATEQGFVDRNMSDYDAGTDSGMGMMSTADFNSMVGEPVPDDVLPDLME